MQANAREREYVETVVVGGGQAGLSVGYHLARLGRPFVILEARPRVGDAWRERWESLRLFTPAWLDSLDGMPFPADRHSFPPKDAMADYLEAYAARFGLPVRTGMKVERVSRQRDRFIVSAGGQELEADNVVIAMSNYQQPRVPAFAVELDPAIVQFHSAEYRSPAQLREGAVLLVGAGNSGSEIAMELASRHTVYMSGRDTGHLPFRLDSPAARLVLARLMLRGIFHRVLTVRTPVGRKVRAAIGHKGGPLIRVWPVDLERAGVQRLPRTVGVRDGRPLLSDGRVLEVANVVWCTGFHMALDWIDLPLQENGAGEPAHTSGVVPGQPGLFFVGRHFLHSLSSAMIHGVGRDASRVAAAIAGRSGKGVANPGLGT